MKSWMFFNWLEDYEDERKMLDNQGYLIGSFINPELVKRMLGKDTETFESTDEEFEEFSKKFFEDNRKQDEKENKGKRKRKRKIRS